MLDGEAVAHHDLLEVSGDLIESITMSESSQTLTVPPASKSHPSRVVQKSPFPKNLAGPLNSQRPHKSTNQDKGGEEQSVSSRHCSPKKTASGSGADWQSVDVSSYKKEEFDFQANLELFDKKKIFSQIKAQDSVKQDERLVAHNLAKRNLHHNENVLDMKIPLDFDDDKVVLKNTINLTGTPERHPKNFPTPQNPSIKLAGYNLQKIIDVAIAEQWLMEDQIIECATTSIVNFLLDSAVDHPALFSGRILLMVSANRLGAIILGLSRYLINRGYNVMAVMPVNLQQQPSYLRARALQFTKFGGMIVADSSMPHSMVLSQSPSDFSICLSAPSVGTWNIQLGASHGKSVNSSRTVLCDIGLPAAFLKDPNDSFEPSSKFGHRLYRIME